MLTKFINIIKCLTSPNLYREMACYFASFYYEHVLPIKAIKKGINVNIHPTVSIRFGEKIVLGNNIAIGPNCGIWASNGSKITIGDNSAIAFGSFIVSSHHGILRSQGFRGQKLIEKDVVIENDVWIGAHSAILCGVTIGKHSIIGAGTVVSKDIPPYTIVTGENRKLKKLRRLGFKK